MLFIVEVANSAPSESAAAMAPTKLLRRIATVTCLCAQEITVIVGAHGQGATWPNLQQSPVDHYKVADGVEGEGVV